MFKRQILTDCMNPTHKITGKSWTGLLGTTRKVRIISAGAIFLAVCAFGAAGVAPLAPDASDVPVKSIAQDLELPNLAEQIAALQQEPQQFIHEEKVRPGDSLASLLSRLGVDDQSAATFIKKDKVAKGIMQLKTGKRVQAKTSDDGQLQWLRTTIVDNQDIPVKTISISRKDNQFVAQETAPKLERRVEMRARTISNSLYSATDSSTDGGKMPDSIVAQIIEMFSTSIDFRTDLKRGDHFNVVYETFWQDGEMVRAGRILAGEFVNRGVTYQSVWFEDPSSKAGGGYYTFDGKALKKSFLKSPLEFSRISSGFSMRVHPISGNWKAHKGIDFAAAQRYADPRFGRWRDRLRRRLRRLRQHGRDQALGQLHHRLRAHEPLRIGPAQGQQSQPGRHHRLRRLDRLVDRRPPALRIPRQQRSA